MDNYYVVSQVFKSYCQTLLEMRFASKVQLECGLVRILAVVKSMFYILDNETVRIEGYWNKFIKSYHKGIYRILKGENSQFKDEQKLNVIEISEKLF